ncbi:dihydrolipoamide acetyltransferase family protein [Streptomyces sp. UNOC14_S4]|uniref:dihydrolipoamide acetyltransferase family protein n=1 Tax=Streptomyces sp. UNOC14_S4 TaxID=2872340 RepID=UPI001E5AAC50|nr:dihydrolipoamide acetyltransferase family protein [Streptomyces sp. UNOC14_S4]MCC3772031.1 2-oxo acid dehydrogenase subunit E2 [Streptomyces sp. UNOC14_S4]
MAVVREFRLPDLGEGLTEAEVVRWLVDVGDVVAVDQPVVEVETAKAMVDVPCPYGGVVTARFGEEGTALPVGAPLLTVAVGEPLPTGSGAPDGPGQRADAGGATEGGTGTVAGSGSDTSGGSGGSTGMATDTAGPSGTAGAEGGSGNVLVGYGTQAPAARRRRVRRPADGRGAVPAAAPGPATVLAAAGAVAAARAVISPLVRRIAREKGLDLARIPGSGPDGLIVRADVERAAGLSEPRESRDLREEQPGAVLSGTVLQGSVLPGTGSGGGAREWEAGAQRIPLRGARGAAAEKLGRSRREIPDATCWVDADATELLAARRAMNAGDGPAVSLLALLARICTAALAEYPELNATVDTGTREIVRLPGVHLGFAAQTDRGLVVPVVRDAHTRSAIGLSTEIARLTEAAREGRIVPAELTGGTFTLNNYGVFGVDGSTPILNFPEAAMLGVGRIVPKPWVHEGQLAVRDVVQLSLTFDHRVCDGGTAGGFLRFVADCVERPVMLLRSI